MLSDPSPAGEARKDPRRQLQGRINHDAGAAFETYILAACDYYRHLGKADIDKTPEPFKVLGSRKPNDRGMWVFEGVFTKPAQPDFQGTLQGGRSIVFEAKTSQSDRIERSVVTAEQEQVLERHYRLGARVYVMVAIRLRQFYRVPWEVWRDMKILCGRKHMKVNDLEPFRLPERNGIILILERVEL